MKSIPLLLGVYTKAWHIAVGVWERWWFINDLVVHCWRHNWRRPIWLHSVWSFFISSGCKRCKYFYFINFIYNFKANISAKNWKIGGFFLNRIPFLESNAEIFKQITIILLQFILNNNLEKKIFFHILKINIIFLLSIDKEDWTLNYITSIQWMSIRLKKADIIF